MHWGDVIILKHVKHDRSLYAYELETGKQPVGSVPCLLDTPPLCASETLVSRMRVVPVATHEFSQKVRLPGLFKFGAPTPL
eukprot:SAG31_NODE_4390_length_3277_cov_1.888609_5_plen_81_part_00